MHSFYPHSGIPTLRSLIIAVFALVAFSAVDAASAWRAIADPRANNGVWMSTATIGWAVGDAGAISKTTDGGVTWVPQASNVTVNLNAVWGADANNIWAVGDSGTIIKYNGTAWSAQGSGVTTDLNSVHGVDASNIWVVGQSLTALKGNGTTWTSQSVPAGPGGANGLFGVWAVNTTNIWTVGQGGRLYKNDGTSWTAQTSGVTSDLYAIWGTSTTNLYTVGQTGVVRFSNNGTSWAAGPTSGVTSILRSISGVDTTHVWISGDAGVIRFYNGTGNFAAQASGAGGQALNSIFASTTTAAQAVGSRKLFDRYNGTTWTVQSSPIVSNVYNACWGTENGDVWCGGNNGSMVHWNGSAFSNVSTGVTQAINDIWGSGVNSVWAVGSNGTILKWNGATWASQTSGTTQALFGVWGTSATDVWAVGNNGVILHFNGSLWSTQTSPVTSPLTSVWAADATHAWAVGNGGTILVYNGVWKTQASPTTAALYRVRGVSTSAVWACGSGGAIIKNVGFGWFNQVSTTTAALAALMPINTTNQWAAGGTTIIKGNGSTWAADGALGVPFQINAAWGSTTSSMYLATGTGMVFVNSPSPLAEISVEEPAGVELQSGKTTIDFGTRLAPNTNMLTFTINSTGTTPLTGLNLIKSGTGASDYTVSALSSSTLANGASATFTVTFQPTADGTRTAALTIPSNDLDEPSFVINFTGIGQLPVGFNPQPLSQAVNPGAKVVFTVKPTGTNTGANPITLKWQKYNTTTLVWDDIVPAATLPTLTLLAVTNANEGDYRVLGTNGLSTTPSSTATLSVNDPVVITTHPATQTASVGDTVVFSVLSTGTETKTYQWRKNGVSILGATGQTYTITNAQTTHGADYSVLVKNMVNTAISNNAGLTVVDANLKTLILPAGGKAVITAPVTGKPTSFTWKKDGMTFSDIRYTFVKNVLTITGLKFAPVTDAGMYTCEMVCPDATAMGGTKTVTSTTKLVVYDNIPEVLGIAPLTMPTAMVGDGSYYYKILVDTSTPLKTPTTFTAAPLPTGLVCNAATGEITGKPAVAITADKPYLVTLTASNLRGKSSKTANLLLKPLPAASVGIFTGPIAREATLNKGLGGRFDMTTTSAGTFSGKLIMGITPYSFVGTLLSDVSNTAAPHATATIVRAGLPSLTVSFTMDLLNHALTNCDITDNTLHAGYSAWRKKWGTVMTTPESDDLKTYLGYYTFGLTIPNGQIGQEPTPQGVSYGYFTVPATGLLTVAGKMADGTAIACATYCGPHGEVLVYQALYGNLGSVLGALDITQGTAGYVPPYGDNTLTGPVSWLRPSSTLATAYTYKAGFHSPETDLTATGGRYVSPTPNLLFGVTDDGSTNNAHVAFTEGLISDTQYSPNVNVRIKLGGAVYVPPHTLTADQNPRSTSLAIVQANGTFSGKTTLVDTNPAVPGTNVTRVVYYYGIIFRSGANMVGNGWFLLPKRPAAMTAEKITTTNILSGKVELAKGLLP